MIHLKGANKELACRCLKVRMLVMYYRRTGWCNFLASVAQPLSGQHQTAPLDLYNVLYKFPFRAVQTVPLPKQFPSPPTPQHFSFSVCLF